nr:MAG TPA: hypothetical protein [Caudoviricetes sp.]
MAASLISLHTSSTSPNVDSTIFQRRFKSFFCSILW